MIFDILEKKLTESGLVVPGESLFRGSMPGETQVGVMTKVPLTGIPVDPHIEGRFRAKIQIITRHTDPVHGEKLANDVSRVLFVETIERHELEDGTKGSIHLFYPMTLPVQFPRLEGNGLEFSQHFEAVWVVDPAWR